MLQDATGHSVLQIAMDVTSCVGWVGLVVRGGPSDFLDLRRPSVVHNTTVKLDLENETAQSVVVRTHNHTLADRGRLSWDVDRDNVAKADLVAGGGVHVERHGWREGTGARLGAGFDHQGEPLAYNRVASPPSRRAPRVVGAITTFEAVR